MSVEFDRGSPGKFDSRTLSRKTLSRWTGRNFGRGDDAVGSPRRAQISQFDLFKLVLLLRLDKQIPVESNIILINTPSPPTKSLDVRGFDSSKLLILRGGNSHVR